jgi:hypothetical protein
MRRFGRILNATAWILSVFIAIVFGSFVILVLGIGGLWVSVWEWVISVLLALSLLCSSYATKGKKAFMRLSVYVLIVFLSVMPVFAAYWTADYQSIAQSLTSSREMDYFRNVLGRSYNYTELIQWENAALSWNSSSSMVFYTDPIQIYEYHQARCGGYAILYAELCISQGYQCRIVVSLFDDHAWDELKIDGNWTRVDASPIGSNEHIGYPLFYEKVWNTPPILALAFKNSSIVDVTSNYRSDHWSLLSLPTIVFVFINAWFAVCIFIVWKKLKTLIVPPRLGQHLCHLSRCSLVFDIRFLRKGARRPASLISNSRAL